MKETVPIIYVKHTDGTRFTSIRDTFLCRQMNDEIPEIQKHIWNTRANYFHLNVIGQYYMLLDGLAAIKDLEYTGIYINFGLPTSRLIDPDDYTNSAEVLMRVKRLAQESKWKYVIITGVPDDRIRDVADLCYEIETIVDHTAVDGEVKHGTCYRKLAAIQ